MKKNNSPEQKQQWKAMQRIHLGFPRALPSGSKAVAFWTWNKNFRGVVALPPETRGAFGRPKAPRKTVGSLSLRVLRAYGQRGSNGEKFTLLRKFQDSCKTVYGVLNTGAVVRLSPSKPWLGKSDRRQVVAHRREDRAQATANLATT